MEAHAIRFKERNDALAEQNAKYAARRKIHALIAKQLQTDSIDAPKILGDARAQIALWEKKRLCSPLYIKAWRKILRIDAAAQLMRVVNDPSDTADALLQNSPFGHVLRHYIAP